MGAAQTDAGWFMQLAIYCVVLGNVTVGAMSSKAALLHDLEKKRQEQNL